MHECCSADIPSLTPLISYTVNALSETLDFPYMLAIAVLKSPERAAESPLASIPEELVNFFLLVSLSPNRIWCHVTETRVIPGD